MLQLGSSLTSADLNHAAFQSLNWPFSCGIVLHVHGHKTLGWFCAIILSKCLPQLCPSSCCRVTLLTCTSSTTLHSLSVGQEGFSPKPFLPFPLQTPSSSVLHSHLCLWVLSPDLARSATESILFSSTCS